MRKRELKSKLLKFIYLFIYLQHLSQTRLEEPSSLFHFGFKWITSWPTFDAIVQNEKQKVFTNLWMIQNLKTQRFKNNLKFIYMHANHTH